MNFWQQLRDAVRGQIEDFFNVRWQAVAAMILVITLLIFNVYWRTTHAIHGNSNSGWVVRDAINVAVLFVLWRARRHLTR